MDEIKALSCQGMESQTRVNYFLMVSAMWITISVDSGALAKWY